jgi:hypothetical protein
LTDQGLLNLLLNLVLWPWLNALAGKVFEDFEKLPIQNYILNLVYNIIFEKKREPGCRYRYWGISIELDPVTPP